MALVDVLIDGEPVGSEMVGDGVTWQGGAQGVIRDVTLAGNERQSILIDGPVGEGSEISEVRLEGGDETKGIVAQRIPDGGNVPRVSGGAKLELSSKIVPVAQAPAPPPPLR